jgi:hypothetical protein
MLAESSLEAQAFGTKSDRLGGGWAYTVAMDGTAVLTLGISPSHARGLSMVVGSQMFTRARSIHAPRCSLGGDRPLDNSDMLASGVCGASDPTGIRMEILPI